MRVTYVMKYRRERTWFAAVGVGALGVAVVILAAVGVGVIT